MKKLFFHKPLVLLLLFYLFFENTPIWAQEQTKLTSSENVEQQQFDSKQDLFVVRSKVLTEKEKTIQSCLQPDIWYSSKEDTPTPYEGKIPLENVSHLSSDEKVLNFHSTVCFDGLDDVLDIPLYPKNNSQFTFISVYQPLLEQTEERSIWQSEETEQNIQLTTHQVSGPNDRTDSYTGGTSKDVVINTVIQYWSEKIKTNTNDGFFRIGASTKKENTKPFKGFLAEYMLFDYALSDEDRTMIESYLALKYGISLPERDYLNSKNEVIWDKTEGSLYTHHLAGIGRDNATGLYQKQATSQTDKGRVIINAGALATLNQYNNTLINDQDFLIWGDNGQECTDLEQADNENFKHLKTKWLMQVNGSTAPQLKTEVRLIKTAIPNPKGQNIYLVIDASGQGQFDSQNMRYIPINGQNVTGDYIVFEDVKWDIDGSGSDVFTFAVGTIPAAITGEEKERNFANQKWNDKENIKQLEAFNIYPNPSSEVFTIEVSLKEEETVSINISDINGRLLNTYTGQNQRYYKFVNNHYPTGIYFVHLQTNTHTQTQKIVVK